MRRLPKRQRDAVCLGFADHDGEDLFTLLLDAEIVTQEQLWEEFGLAEAEFNDLWARLPILDNTDLAARLGATPQQLSKWRFLAWKQVRANLREALKSEK